MISKVEMLKISACCPFGYHSYLSEQHGLVLKLDMHFLSHLVVLGRHAVLHLAVTFLQRKD